MDVEQKDAWITETFNELFADEIKVATELYMDADDWKILSKKGCIGTHGHQHLPMATLSTERMRLDIEMSMTAIRDVTGSDVRGIAYPFGGETAVSNELFNISRDCGLTYGFTMRRAINTDKSEHLLAMALNRIDVNDLPKYIP